MAELTFENITKKIQDIDIIKDISFHIQDGEFVVLVGPSGCGKSTILRMIAGLETVSSGHIIMNKNDITDLEPAARKIAMVFQSYALYPHMSVAENMGFGLKMTGRDKADIAQRVQKAAHILHLENLLDRKPKQLSGGQRQRVAIGRAIVREPEIFLFDEPLSNLDAELRIQMRLEIAHLHKELGTTMIYVTHDQTEAMTLADKIVVLNNGIIEQIGTPLGLYDNPNNMFVAGFIGSPQMNFIDVIISHVTDDIITLLCDGNEIDVKTDMAQNYKENDALIIGIRPESFTDSGQYSLSVTINVVEKLGYHQLIYGKTSDGQAITIMVNRDMILQENTHHEFCFSIESLYLFDKKTQQRIKS